MCFISIRRFLDLIRYFTRFSSIKYQLGSIISAHGCWMHFKERSLPNQERVKFLKRDSSPVDDNEASPLNQITVNREVGFWGNLMHSIYQTCAGAVFLTDIVFWCLLLPFQTGDNFKLTLLIGCMHSVNVVFLLIDSALNSLVNILYIVECILYNFRVVHLLFYWILFENVMLLHRTKATFIGLLDAKRSNEWV